LIKINLSGDGNTILKLNALDKFYVKNLGMLKTMESEKDCHFKILTQMYGNAKKSKNIDKIKDNEIIMPEFVSQNLIFLNFN
jgi:hypothetical protein